MAGGNVIRRSEGRTGESVENGEEFRSVQNVAVISGPVGFGIADDFADAVHRAIGSFAGNLRAAIAVQIVNHELRVMRPFADVEAEIDGPQQRAVEFVRLQHRRIGEAGLGIVPPTRRHVNDDFILAVAVEIADGNIVGRGVGGRLQGDGQVLAHRSISRQHEARTGGNSSPATIGRTK
jgi:hypothetical protein